MNEMASLNLLPSSTIHRIASSQVITSVSTAVKELVENSLDAGADNVEVKLEEYGFGRIEVRDNGCGIKISDVEVMAQRHYTSKINCFENLTELTTYGFRGEALCSLCSVGNVTITTKTEENAVAQCYTLGQAGKIRSTRPLPSSTGTTVVVGNLFKNLPVRKQFLSSTKKCKEELKKVEDLMMAFGSIHPGVRLVLWHNKSIIWQKSKSNNYKTALISVFGRSVMSHMEQVDYIDEESNFEIFGYLPKPGSDPSITCRTSNDRGYIFINNRPVVMKGVSQLIRQHYTPAGLKHPFVFLSIKLPPDGVDVNLEPNKTHVLLTEKEKILDALQCLLEKFYVQASLDKDSYIISENHLCQAGNDSFINTGSIGENGADLSGIAGTNVSDFSVDGNFNPVASSTLCTTAHDGLLDSNFELDTTKSNPITSAKNSCLPQNVTSNGRTDTNNVADTDSNNSVISDSLLCLTKENNISNDVEAENHNTFNKENISERIHVCESNRGLTKVTIDQMKDATVTSNSNKCGDIEHNVELSMFEGTNQAANDQKIPGESLCIDVHQKNTFDKLEESKEEAEKIDQLVNINGTSEATNNHDGSKENTSLNYDDVFDDDIEFEQILKDIADKKIPLSQATQQTSDKDPNKSENGKSVVNNVDEKSWSMGNVVKDKQGNLVEPVQLLTSATLKGHNQTTPQLANCQRSIVSRNVLNQTTPIPAKRKHSSDSKGKKQPSSKKIHSIPQILNQSLITFHASQSPKERLKQGTKVVVSFSLQNLKMAYNNNSKTGPSDLKKNELIGWLEPSGVWLMLQQTEILFVNHCRIQEQILYHKLMQTHVLPREKLENSIQLSSRIIGGDDCWDVLINLKSQSDLVSASKTIIDERIKSNGFEIRIKHDSETGGLKVDLISICTSLPFYGVPDLAEVLGLIKSKGVDSCLLEECRPLKVLNYLKGEAVRISRAQTSRRSREDVEALLDQMEECLPKHVRNCLHEQPFFGQIADISNLLQ